MRQKRKDRFVGSIKNFVLRGTFLLITAGILTACGKKTSYEGANLSFVYDASRWTMEGCTQTEYPVLALSREDSSLTFMAVRDNSNIMEGFHDSMVDLYQMIDHVTEIETVDQWKKQTVFCYVDLVAWEDETENSSLICYGKTEGEWQILAIAEYPEGESDAENKETNQEIMEILNSLTVSQTPEVSNIKENSDYQYFYDIVTTLLEYGITQTPDTGNAAGRTADETEQMEETATGNGALISDEDASSLQYVKKFMVEDYYGDKTEYPVYAPVNSESSYGYLGVYDYEHGISYGASACDNQTPAFMYEYFETSADLYLDDWRTSEDYSDVKEGEVYANGDDRYLFISAKKTDYQGTPYAVNTVIYLDAQGGGACVLWTLELSEMAVAEETYQIVDELARCYGISLDELKTDGEWIEANRKKEEENQDKYQPEEGELRLTAVAGYQYMGSTELTSYDEKARCKVLAPMGQQTSVYENHIYSSMHGVHVSIGISNLAMQNYQVGIKMRVDGEYDYLTEAEEVKDVWKSEVLTIPEYEQACYVVFEYKNRDSADEDYVSQVKIKCFIRINDDYILENEITLHYEEYDDSTNTVLSELETAYGIDLADYYYEK